jgi:single-strand DNA-binding protein
VTYVDVEVWGRTAENCKQYLSKGRSVFVEGQLRLDQWEQDGQKRSKLRVRALMVQFLGGPAGSGGARSGGGSYDQRPAATSSGKTAAPSASVAEDRPPPPQDEDDIPF